MGGGPGLAPPGWVRTLALVVATVAVPGCLYTEIINVAPEAHIERVDPGTEVHIGGLVVVSARTSQDPDGDTLSYQWAVRRCEGCVAFAANDGMQFGFMPAEGHQPLLIDLAVTDEHGARATASLQLEVNNRAPTVSIVPQGTLNPDGTFTVGTEVFFSVTTSDEDLDPVAVKAVLHTPPASDPKSYAFTDGGNQIFTLLPDVAGQWELEITATDEFGGSTTVRRAVTIGADQPPCLTSTQPAWSPDAARVLLIRDAGARRFMVAGVADDLDPYPGSNELHFRWWVAPPDGALAEIAGHDLPELTVDPRDLDPGDTLAVRVEISDRTPRVLPCAMDQAACSIPATTCYQRLTWTAEVR